jgi:hypothetical protein
MTPETLSRRLLMLLTWDLRAVTLEHLVGFIGAWREGPVSVNAARKVIGRLVKRGLISRLEVMTKPALLPLEGLRPLKGLRPLVTWRPGRPRPCVRRLSWKLARRWSKVPLQSQVVYYASPRAVGLYGGPAPGRLKNLPQLGHDLCVPTILLSLHLTAPALAACWRSEDVVEDVKYQKKPDAFLYSGPLFDPAARPVLALEVGGLYGPKKLSGLFDDLEGRNLPLELY